MSIPIHAPEPATRSHTALFVLLGKTRGNRSGDAGAKAERIVYPVNRPGQNAAECYTIAALAFLLTAGPPTVVIGRSLGGHVWSFALAVLLAALCAFVAFHILFFSFAFIYRTLHRLGLLPSCAPRKLPDAVYLNFFTALAVIVWFTGDPWLMASAIPWLAWFLVNLLAGTILLASRIPALRFGNRK